MTQLSPQHQRLAVHLGGQFARLIGPRLAEIVAAVTSQQRQASFSTTAEFKPKPASTNDPENLYKITLKPRLRTPDEAIEIDLQMVDGQLSLYERDTVTEAVAADMESPDPKGNGASEPEQPPLKEGIRPHSEGMPENEALSTEPE